MPEINTIHPGDCISGLKLLPDNSVDCCVTSPPYYGLRDYGVDGQMGHEDSPEVYIQRLVEVFREVKRVIKDEGTIWVNIADSYAGSGRGVGDTKRTSAKQRCNAGSHTGDALRAYKDDTIKPKDLIGIPWMLAFALRADGWYLRQDIIWSKPNPMPESVTDRCTKSHEYIFLLSKSSKYYFDTEAIAEPVAASTIKRCSQDVENQTGSIRIPGKTNGAMKARLPRYGGNKYSDNPDKFYKTKSGNMYELRPKRNKRSVWVVSTKPYKEAHFATFPDTLIIDCIKAGCPEGGLVLDPFMGSGTTAVVSRKLDRNYIGFELNPEYIKIAKKRMHEEIGMFNLKMPAL